MSEQTGIPRPTTSDLRAALQGGLLKQIRLITMAMAASPLPLAGLGYWLTTRPALGAPPDPVLLMALGVIACVELGMAFVVPPLLLRRFSFNNYEEVGYIQGPNYSAEDRAKAVGMGMTRFYLIRAALLESVAVLSLVVLFFVGGHASSNPIYYAPLAPMILVGVVLGMLVPDEAGVEEVFKRHLESN